MVSTHHLKQLPPSGPAGQEGVDVLVSRCDLVDRPGEEQGVSGHRKSGHLYRGAGVVGVQTEPEQGAWWLPNTAAVECCPTTLDDGGERGSSSMSTYSPVVHVDAALDSLRVGIQAPCVVHVAHASNEFPVVEDCIPCIVSGAMLLDGQHDVSNSGEPLPDPRVVVLLLPLVSVEGDPRIGRPSAVHHDTFALRSRRVVDASVVLFILRIQQCEHLPPCCEPVGRHRLREVRGFLLGGSRDGRREQRKTGQKHQQRQQERRPTCARHHRCLRVHGL